MAPRARDPDLLNLDAVDASDRDANVFELLADQARDRHAAGLWMTTLGGATNAALLWSQYKRLHWLAAGFVAVAAYGAWALADRALHVWRSQDRRRFDAAGLALSAVRALVAPAGIIAALAAVAGFMAAALGNWNH